MRVTDLGPMPYRAAWAVQEAAHARVVAGGEEELLLVEHPPVITLGRRAEAAAKNIVATPEALAAVGVELVESDRGGDVTFHGPGQIVAYPIVRLNNHRLSVGAFVRTLEQAVIDALADVGIAARREAGAVGVWTDDPTTGEPAKVCAVGVRIRRGVSLHGVALNATTDLRYFDLIVPCGLTGRPVTSVAKLLGEKAPPIETVRAALAGRLVEAFKAVPTPTIHAGV